MDLTKESILEIEKLTQESTKTEVLEFDGRKYIVGTRAIHRVQDLSPRLLALHTLSGFIKAIAAERSVYDAPLFAVVESPKKVSAVTELLEDLERDTPYAAEAKTPEFRFGQYYVVEDFIVGLRSKFCETEDSKSILEMLKKVKSAESVELCDDGITQSVQVQKGISLTGMALTKPIVSLRPYRTFLEVEQPESEFLFRIKDGCAALFEADGGAWELKAKQNIADYLSQKFDAFGVKNIHVIV